jgi:hypothetical protein
MPSAQEHCEKAKHNEAFSASLAATAFQDWRATGVFYAAVHYVDGFLATQGVHPPDHRARDSYVGLDPHLIMIYAGCRRLKRDSEDARYRFTVFSEQHIVGRTLSALEHIKNHLRPRVPGI